MRLQTLVEIVCADASHDDGDNDQEDGEDGEARQGFAGGLVVIQAGLVGGVHAHQLKQKVRQCAEIDDDDGNHANDRLAPHPKRGEEEEHEGYDQGGSCEALFDGLGVVHDDEELYGEGEEEEEVELEEGDVNLGSESAKLRERVDMRIPGSSDTASSCANQH